MCVEPQSALHYEGDGLNGADSLSCVEKVGWRRGANLVPPCCADGAPLPRGPPAPTELLGFKVFYGIFGPVSHQRTRKVSSLPFLENRSEHRFASTEMTGVVFFRFLTSVTYQEFINIWLQPPQIKTRSQLHSAKGRETPGR